MFQTIQFVDQATGGKTNQSVFVLDINTNLRGPVIRRCVVAPFLRPGRRYTSTSPSRGLLCGHC